MTTTETALPTWDEMSDLDRGAALRHVWKRHWEGSAAYAVENYPCQYIENPTLIALDELEACRHATRVCDGNYFAVERRIGADEVMRLSELAGTEGRKILDSRKMWAARAANGNVLHCDDESQARFLVENPGWRCVELLHRTEVGGDWTVMFDARGLEQPCPIGRVRKGDLVRVDETGEWSAALTDTYTYNAARSGPLDGPTNRHTFADITAEHVTYVLNLANGTTIRQPVTEHAGHGDPVLIRRGETS